MANCLLHAVNTGTINISKRHLIVYSDNCVGQMFVALYTFLFATGLFDIINYKFLMSGYNFSAFNPDLALTETWPRRSIY